MEDSQPGSGSDSSTSCRKAIINNKRSRAEETNNNASSAARFKGVVAQQNGHWGAQIYTHRQRIWLGTFNSENEAAMAYDSASIKLRSGDSYRNFGWSNETIEEPNFQKLYSRETILNMIKDGSYQSKFLDYLRNCDQDYKGEGDDVFEKTMKQYWNGKFVCRQLFQKELTPSDVGKLNRLVIPKKYAEKFFPKMSSSHDVVLVFYDKLMSMWKFRYCYWKSSQSYVFTRGWNRFVKEKKLEANDIVTFYSCQPLGDDASSISTMFLVDVMYKKETNGCGGGEILDEQAQDILRMRGGGKRSSRCSSSSSISIRLFGVEIKLE